MITQESLSQWIDKQQSAEHEHDSANLCEACAFHARIKDSTDLELLTTNVMARIIETFDASVCTRDAIITGMWIGYQLAMDENFIKEMERMAF